MEFELDSTLVCVNHFAFFVLRQTSANINYELIGRSLIVSSSST
jgi:hypothetical protein